MFLHWKNEEGLGKCYGGEEDWRAGKSSRREDKRGDVRELEEEDRKLARGIGKYDEKE